MQSKRRDFLALWAGACATAAWCPGAGGAETAFFTPSELEVLRKALAILIPADDRSRGGEAAGLTEYIGFILSRANSGLQEEWRRGLAVLAAAKNLESLLRRLARNEFRARTRDERFFVLLKSAAVDAFYTSEEGITRELGYQGMGHVMEFPDFSGTKAETPAGYRPMLRAHA